MDLGNGVVVRYAQCLHPKESKKKITVDQVDAYKEILKEGDFCIDIGAHTGDSTLPMALAVGKTGCVLAFEPNPYVFHVLEKNSRTNSQLVEIKPILAAASPNEGFLEFEYSDSGFCNGGRHEGISALTHGHAFKQEVFCVDIERELREDFSHFLPRLKMIKVDAEGYDLYVLRSLADTISEYKPIIKTEVFKNTDQTYRRDLLDFMRNNDYFAYKIVNEPITAGEILTEANLEEWPHYDILCLPNNK
jgi:FkbM family methyltransferase